MNRIHRSPVTPIGRGTVVLLLGLLLAVGCKTDGKEMLDQLEEKVNLLQSYREVKSIGPRTMNVCYLLKDGTVLAKRTENLDGSILIEDFEAGHGFLIQGDSVTKYGEASPDGKCPPAFAGNSLRNEDACSYVGDEDVDGVSCAVFETEVKGRSFRHAFGLDDGLLRRLSFPSPRGEGWIETLSRVEDLNGVDEGLFGLPEGVEVTRELSAEEMKAEAMNKLKAMLKRMPRRK